MIGGYFCNKCNTYTWVPDGYVHICPNTTPCNEKKAFLCPVCNGTGKIPNGMNSGTAILYNTCHGCDGKGWVTV